MLTQHRGRVVTPQSVHTLLLTVISHHTVIAGVITTCQGKVVSDSQRLPNSTAVIAGPCSGKLLRRSRKLEQADAYICSVYVALSKLD